MRLRISSLLLAGGLLLASVAPATAQVYPLKDGPTLSYFMQSNVAWSNRYKTLSETPFGKELSKRTGVTVNFTNPVPAQFDQAFNLMLASGDLPDLIENNFLTKIPGGPDKAIKDGYITRLNDVLPKWAPNLTAYLKAHPEVDKMVKSDEGNYYGFPFIRTDPYLMVFQGPIIRQDWLDDLKLKVPETIDDWTVMLKAFKEKKGATAPFSMAPNNGPTNAGWISPAFSGAYGAIKNWYIDNGKVKYGPAETQYKDFLKLMAGWYKAGYLDPNFALSDSKQRDALFVAGMSGATVANAGAGIGYLIKLMSDKDPKARFVAAPYPVLKRGDKPKFGQMDLPYTGLTVAISTKTKNLEAAVRFLDYGYSPEGALFHNFGTPGVSYTMVGGYPTYTEYIMNNKTLSINEAMAEHIRGSINGPFLQDKRYAEQFFMLPEQKAAIPVWANTDMAKHLFPNLSPDKADIAEMSKMKSEFDTFVNEYFIKTMLSPRFRTA